MADELLLRTSLQRERDEIVRLQSQLRQQSQQQKMPQLDPSQKGAFLAPHPIPPPKLDLVEQQRRLLELQKQQQQFQQGQQQQMAAANGQQQTLGRRHHNPIPTPPMALLTSANSIPPPPPLPSTAATMSPSFAAAAAAFLLAQHQQSPASISAAAAKFFGTVPSPASLPLLLSPTDDILANMATKKIDPAHGASPCPTPAYHYHLAAPKPIQAPMNFVGLDLGHHPQQQQGAPLMGVDVRPADSTTTMLRGGMRDGQAGGGGDGMMGGGDGMMGGGGGRRKEESSGNDGKEEPMRQNSPQAGNGLTKPAGETSPRLRRVPVFQISPQQLHMAMQQFFRSQQSKDSDSGYSTAGGPQSPSEDGGASSPKGTAGILPPSKCGEEEGERPEEYVDVVGDGEARSSFLKVQRKAHIEFYRKLKSFRNRGVQLDCQLCLSPVPNSDASIRSHVHGHCKTALFVCKLCQRGFQDQHLVFEHIGKEHPAHKGTQFIEDRRDMGILMELLAECFPRVLCRARDCLFEAIGRLTAWAECHGHTQIACRLCSLPVMAQKNALYGHLNQHPSYKCKKCKFSCTDERGQLEHQRREHPGGLDMAGGGKERTFCVSLAFDVLLDTLKTCFPLDQIGQEKSSCDQSTKGGGGRGVDEEKPKGGKKKGMMKGAEEGKRRGRKRKHRRESTSSEELGEEECSWTEED